MSDETKAPEKQDEKNHQPLILKKVAAVGGIVLIIILIGYLIYFQSNSHAEQRSAQTRITHLEQEVAHLSNNTQGIENQLVQNEQVIAHLSEKTDVKDKQWVLAEASYLVKLANFNLQFSHNLPEAELLLKIADHRIASLKDPNLIPVRKSLAEDMAKLAGVPKIDEAGLLLKLNAISGQVNDLPIIATPEDVKPAESSHHHHHHQPGWKRNLEQGWREIRKLVVVQYHDQPMSKLMSPVNRAYLDMHLHLLLSQASWAIMHGKGTLYQASLQQAQIWVRNYYVGNSAKTQAMINALSTLASVNINPKYPDISNTLQVISNAMK